MKKGIKTLAMWLIIGVIVIVLLSSIMENSSSKMTYSELVTSIENREVENIKISADSLRWNGKSEQLTSGRNDMVKIEQNDTVMYGSGFSASGVSKKYAFTGVVSGEIKQNKVQEEVETNEQQ